MKTSARSSVAPFQVMSILDRVAQLRAQGRDIISLCAGEPSGGAPEQVRTLASTTHASGESLGYTSALGLRSVRQEISAHYGRWYGLDVPAERVAVTTGSSGAFMLTFLAAFDAGDVVVLARPGYPAYRNILTTLGCRVVEVDCGAAVGFQPTPELLDGIEYFLFPNFMPWAGFLTSFAYRFRPDGHDPDSCVIDIMVLEPVPEGDERPAAPATRYLGPDESWSDAPELGVFGRVFNQDGSTFGRVQRGLRASVRPTTTLGSYQESRIRHFHATLDAYIDGRDRG